MRQFAVFLFAIIVTAAGFIAAVLVGGPAIRELLGPPPGFHEDFTSREAFRQALLVQTIFLGIGFLILGFMFNSGGRPSWKMALTAANPLTVGLGFVAFRWLYEWQRLGWDYEYEAFLNGAMLALVAPILFAICFLAGASMRKP